MKQCSKCLAEFEDAYSFCSKCGGPLTDIASADDEGGLAEKLCSRCGAHNDPAYRYCMKCGQPFEESLDESSDSEKTMAEFWYGSPSGRLPESGAGEDVKGVVGSEPPTPDGDTSSEERKEVVEDPESPVSFSDQASEEDTVNVTGLQGKIEPPQEEDNGEDKDGILADRERGSEEAEGIERDAEFREVRIDDDRVTPKKECQTCNTLNEEICIYCRHCGRPLDVSADFGTVATPGALAPLAGWGKKALKKLSGVEWSPKVSAIGSRIRTLFLLKLVGWLKTLLERIRRVPWSDKLVTIRSTIASLLFWKPANWGKRISGTVRKIRWSRKGIAVISGAAVIVLTFVVGLLVLPPNWLASTEKDTPFSSSVRHGAESQPAEGGAQTTPDRNFGEPTVTENGVLPQHDSPIHYWDNHRPPPEMDQTNVVLPDVPPPEGSLDTFEKAFSEGLEATGAGNFELAEEKFQAAVRFSPNDARAWTNLGLTQRKLGNLEGAVISYHSALKIKPDFALAYKNLGVVLEKMGNLEQAIEAYLKYVQLAPEATDAAQVKKRAEMLATKTMRDSGK